MKRWTLAQYANLLSTKPPTMRRFCILYVKRQFDLNQMIFEPCNVFEVEILVSL